MEIYKVAFESKYSSYKEAKEHNVVSQGWMDFGDLSFAYGNEYWLNKFLNFHHCGDSFKNAFRSLAKTLKTSDIVLAFEGNTLKGIAEIPQDFIYFYNEDLKFYKNCLFPINWVDWSDFCQDKNLSGQGGQGVPGIVSCGLSKVNDYINKNWETYKDSNGYNPQLPSCQEKLELLKGNFESKKEESLKKFISKMENDKIKEYKSLLVSNHNLILTGAPGTGKTYLAKEIAQLMIFEKIIGEQNMTPEQKEQFNKQVGFVQFHPSYDYTDFIEGLRPIQDDNGTVGFKRKDGVFKKFCEKALESTIVKGTDNFEESWTKLLDYLDSNDFLEVPLLSGKGVFKVEINEYGDGLATRTYENDTFEKGQWLRGQSKFFSKDQLYNVYRGLKGTPAGGHDNYRKAIIEKMKEDDFGLLDFKQGESGNSSKTAPFIFIIDEINRGEISKIFGELFFSIDPGYRGIAGKVRTQYANMLTEPSAFDNALGITDSDNYGHFFIPNNVFIIGTMNDIDRSVESMDFAFRRRFAFKEIKANENVGMLEILETPLKDDAIKRMNNLNKTIEEIEGLSSAYHIGASYFLKLENYKDGNKFEQLWENHIKGLLQEYLRGNPDMDNLIKKLEFDYNNKDQNVTSENN